MSITIPKNVRQMGEPEAARKIYVEDYVVTYLRQYAKEEILNSRGAILLGRAEEQDGVPYLFIRSALEIQGNADSDGIIAFTDQMWMQIYEEIEKYFKGQEILGWFLSVPGFPLEVNYEILSAHRNYFSGQDKVLLMEDPTEGDEAFFAMKEGCMVRQNGYFIFYERNEPMQQYMLEKRDGKSVDAEGPFTDRAARNFRMIVQEKKEQNNQKRVMTFLYGVSTFLVMVVLVIGITMINNYEKMEQVEMALNNLTQNLESQQETALANNSGTETGSDLENGADKKSDGADSQTAEDPSADPNANGAAISNASAKDSGEPANEEPAGTLPADVQPADAQQAETQPASGQAETQAAAVAAHESYTVQKGDTLLSISRKIYGNDRRIKDICQLNGIEDSDMIYAGEKILLP